MIAKPNEYVDSQTAYFILKLRCSNMLWYNYAVRCAQADAQTLRRCLKQVPIQFPNDGYSLDGVNYFQICRAVNEGFLTEDQFNSAWQCKVDQIKERISNHKAFGVPLWF